MGSKYYEVLQIGKITDNGNIILRKQPKLTTFVNSLCMHNGTSSQTIINKIQIIV